MIVFIIFHCSLFFILRGCLLFSFVMHASNLFNFTWVMLIVCSRVTFCLFAHENEWKSANNDHYTYIHLYFPISCYYMFISPPENPDKYMATCVLVLLFTIIHTIMRNKIRWIVHITLTTINGWDFISLVKLCIFIFIYI